MIKAVVLDIDGTLANDTYRLNRARKEDGDLDFDILFNHNLVALDPPMDFGIYNPVGQVEPCDRVIFLTGRPESLRPVTQWWLMKHFCQNTKFRDWSSQHSLLKPSKYILCMRQDEDLRPNIDIKRDILTHCHNTIDGSFGGFTFTTCFDNVSEGDLQERVDMYRSLGIKMFHVDSVDFWKSFDWNAYHKIRTDLDAAQKQS